MEPLGTQKELLFTLVLQVGFAASLAALLVRFVKFRRVLFNEIRDSDQKVLLLLFLTPPLAIGVVLRLVGYHFFDLTLPGAFLLGLLGGRMVGLLGGSMLSLPAFGNHEWIATPLAALVGLLAGVIRQGMPNKEDVWHFGPFLFLNIPKSIWRLARYGQLNWAMVPLGACAVLELGRYVLAYALHGKWLYTLAYPDWRWVPLIILATVMCVAMPIKIWNNTRIEMNLEQNQQLLLKARMDALSSQINPHFLFNTLNTVSSLVRYDPDMARIVVIKLSNILRRLLRKHETFVPLRDELDFIDDYLDIEVARFGRDKLQFFKEVEESTLDTFVPSMLLQPIIENAIRHGLAPKLEGGEIRLRTRTVDGRLTIDIADNGMGISSDRLARIYNNGIGISNVRERLRLLYGDQFRMDIHSREGDGTQIRIEIPELVSAVTSALI
ncbi:MAG TPA: histidine kinase [Candidatus Acidoferrales bacterium]|nr:histidine kinase [Candidatus Acidoferrales bacterium]